MMKRNNEGIGGESFTNSSNDDSHQKRRKIQFEAVRLPAVANVNDINNRTKVYVSSKLRQSVLTKTKRIHELERENERAKRRQQTDESNFMKVYNSFSEIEKFVCAQVKNELGDFFISEPAPTGTEVQGMNSEFYNKFAEQAKLNLKNAFAAFGKARHERLKESTAVLNRLKSLMDDPSHNFNEIHRALAAKSSADATELEKVNANLTKAQTDLDNANRKRRNVADKNAVLENKIQELEQQLNEQREDTYREYQYNSKLEDRVIVLTDIIEKGNISAGPEQSNQAEKKVLTPATPPSESTAREMENLRFERDEQSSLAARRLQELEDLNKKIQMYAQENSKLKMEIHKNVSTDDIQNSEEYKSLKKYYSLVMKEFDRVNKELEEVIAERDMIRNAKEARANMMAEEQQKTMKEFQSQNDIHNAFYRVSHDSEILRCEFETIKEEYNKSVKQSEWDEMKATLNSFRAMNATMKASLERVREKEKLGQKELQSLRSELKTLKEKQAKCYMVPIEGPEIPKPAADDKHQVEITRLRTEIRRLMEGKKIKEEIDNRIGDKLAELETLRKANETLTSDEQCISDELESICNAVEEEQERNAQLFIEKREQEDRNLKMMNERMVQNQVLNKLRDKLEALESKAQTDAQIVKIHEYEKKTSEEKMVKLNDSIQFKSSEIGRLTNLLDIHRKQMQDIGKARDEYKSKVERSEEHLKQFQESYALKTREIEDLKQRKKRLEEDLDTLRTRQEHAKRSDMAVSQTGDQVLEEANRQMKETLTCPSCKTRPKDCIMLKCYHLFCETCIKTMYDTRQRKCPKCNSNFGANDFHRIFI